MMESNVTIRPSEQDLHTATWMDLKTEHSVKMIKKDEI